MIAAACVLAYCSSATPRNATNASSPKSSALAFVSPAACLARGPAERQKRNGREGQESSGKVRFVGAGRVKVAGSHARRLVRIDKVSGRHGLPLQRTERFQTITVLHGGVQGTFLDHRLVRRDARFPEFVHESIFPRKRRRLKELRRLVPHRDRDYGKILTGPRRVPTARHSSSRDPLASPSERGKSARRDAKCGRGKQRRSSFKR